MRVGREKSELFSVQAGESEVSPWLFKFYMAGLVKELKEEPLCFENLWN